jgi:hypothetical protein
MKWEIASLVRRLQHDESGAVLVLVSIMIVALIGLAALAIDIGNLAYTQRMLQATADLAAEAGALEIYGTNSATVAAIAYSAENGEKNVQAGPPVTPTATLKALNGTSSGGCPNASEQSQYPACTLSTATNPNANAILVKQQVTVSPILRQIFGKGPVTLTATSLALARGPGPTPPLNVMIIVDTTESMSNFDPNATTATCGTSPATKVQCALFGARSLMNALVAAQDYVGIMVFPPLNTSTATNCGTNGHSACGAPVSYDSDCSQATTPIIAPYNAPSSTSTYQVVGLSNNYQTSSGALNTSSPLVTAVQGSSGCYGISAIGGEHTYFAAAITAAQTALTSLGSHQAGVQNIMILESDGEAGNGTGGPSSNQCNLAIAAAQTAAQAGTWVYSVAYGTSTAAGSCSDTETTQVNTPYIRNVTACQTMQNIASSPGALPNPSLFFSDSSGTPGGCTSQNAASDLGAIFQQIAHSLTHTALVPCGTSVAGGFC